MVATVNDVVSTLLGDYAIDPKDISPHEWRLLIRKTLDKLCIEHFRGFKAVGHLFQYDREYGLHRSTKGIFADLPVLRVKRFS